jgi:hypothetical protein
MKALLGLFLCLSLVVGNGIESFIHDYENNLNSRIDLIEQSSN